MLDSAPDFSVLITSKLFGVVLEVLDVVVRPGGAAIAAAVEELGFSVLRWFRINKLMVGTGPAVADEEVVETFFDLTGSRFLGADCSVTPYLGPNEHKVQSALHCNDVKLAFVKRSAIWRVVRTYSMNSPGSSRTRSNSQSMSMR